MSAGTVVLDTQSDFGIRWRHLIGCSSSSSEPSAGMAGAADSPNSTNQVRG